MKYSPFELEDMLDSIVILVDTREQPGAKFNRRMEALELPHERYKLDFGDYSYKYTNIDGEEVYMDKLLAIERKMDLNELAQCFGTGRARFKREFERVGDAQLFLLVENDNWEDAYSGAYGPTERFRSQLNPKAMVASLNAWEQRYGMRVRFCKADTTGGMIRDICHYHLKEVLQNEE